jgi:hypothetical protein
MALYTVTQLAELLGISKGNVSKAKSRGNIIFDGKLIDDTHPVNVAFIKRNQRGKTGKPRELFKKPPEIPDVEITGNATVPPKHITLDARDIHDQKIIADIDNKKLEASLKRQKLEKFAGENISVEAATKTINILSEAINSSWEQELSSFLIEFGKTMGLSREQICELESKKITVSNSARLNAIKEAKKNIEIAQKESMNKKGRGEWDRGEKKDGD